MAEEFCRVGEIELSYETFGDPADPTMLLVMGLGTQMVAWRRSSAPSSGHGFRVVRFDNRDIGRSTRVGGAPRRPRALVLRSPKSGALPLDDMAADAGGCSTSWGSRRARRRRLHRRHDRPEDGRPAPGPGAVAGLDHVDDRQPPEGQPQLKSTRCSCAPRPPSPRPTRSTSRRVRRIGSHGFDRDEGEFREGRRGYPLRGEFLRGACCGRSPPSPRPATGPRRFDGIVAPTLVIHGDRDIMVHPSGGKATARAIPGAHLMTIEGMGHDLPRRRVGPDRGRDRRERPTAPTAPGQGARGAGRVTAGGERCAS